MVSMAPSDRPHSESTKATSRPRPQRHHPFPSSLRKPSRPAKRAAKATGSATESRREKSTTCSGSNLPKRSKDKTQSKRKPGQLRAGLFQRLPLEILELVFFESENTNLPRCNPLLGARLSGHGTLVGLLMRVFGAILFDREETVLQQNAEGMKRTNQVQRSHQAQSNHSRRARLQTQVLACRWLTAELLVEAQYRWLGANHASCPTFTHRHFSRELAPVQNAVVPQALKGLLDRHVQCHDFRGESASGPVAIRDCLALEKYFYVESRIRTNHQCSPCCSCNSRKSAVHQNSRILLDPGTRMPEWLWLAGGPYNVTWGVAELEARLRRTADLLFWLAEAGMRFQNHVDSWEATVEGVVHLMGANVVGDDSDDEGADADENENENEDGRDSFSVDILSALILELFADMGVFRAWPAATVDRVVDAWGSQA